MKGILNGSKPIIFEHLEIIYDKQLKSVHGKYKNHAKYLSTREPAAEPELTKKEKYLQKKMALQERQRNYKPKFNIFKLLFAPLILIFLPIFIIQGAMKGQK